MPRFRRRARPDSEQRFQIGEYYLDQPYPDRGGYWYACRYDPRSREIRRRSLAEPDFERAKIALAALVSQAPAEDGRTPDPSQVLTEVALKLYVEGHATTIRSESEAARARILVQEYLDSIGRPEAPVSFWTPTRQLEFCRWCRDTYGHAPASIERWLDVINAAFRDMAAVKMRGDPIGGEVEAQLMTHAPKFVYKRDRIAKELKIAPSKPRHSGHTLSDIGALIDRLDEPHLLRYAILALNTWARPEAILEFDPETQYDRAAGLIHLNPPGRVQTNKRRPTIPVTAGLRGWIPAWAREDEASRRAAAAADKPLPEPGLLVFNGKRVSTVKKAIARHAKAAGLGTFSLGKFRHFMATNVRRHCRGVTREQRSLWMGHTVREGSQTTDNYEAFDPEYLYDVALATDFLLQQIQRHTSKKLFTVEVRLNRDDLKRIGATPSGKLHNLQRVNGAR